MDFEFPSYLPVLCITQLGKTTFHGTVENLPSKKRPYSEMTVPLFRSASPALMR